MSDDHLLIGAATAQVTRHPVIQVPGQPEKLSSVTFGGPDNPRDRVMVLSVQQLALMLDVARTSPAQRVELPFVGVRVDTYQGRGTRGRYEVWKLVSGKPRPERPSIFEEG